MFRIAVGAQFGCPANVDTFVYTRPILTVSTTSDEPKMMGNHSHEPDTMHNTELKLTHSLRNPFLRGATELVGLP